MNTAVRKTKLLIGWLPLLSGVLMCVSCSVREQVENCQQYALTVKAVDVTGNDLTGTGTVTSVDIYLFSEERFVRRVPSGTSADFLFAHDKAATLTLVAWGNLKADSLEVPEIAAGTPIEQAQLSLRRKESGYNLPITDLFYSRQDVSATPAKTRGITEESITLVLERRAAGMSVRTRYFTDQYDKAQGTCHFVIRGTGTALNFLGQAVGSGAGYEPVSATDQQGDTFAAPFRVFPTEASQQIEIDLYQGEKLLMSVVNDSQGKPLHAVQGEQMNVEIDFRNAIAQVTVTVEEWGEMNQDTMFP